MDTFDLKKERKMKSEENINYSRVAKAIDYIRQNFKEQPDLGEVADQVHLSPYHFQRLFTDWAGVSPKKFLQYISLEYAKQALKANGTTLSDAAHASGLSGTGRLHDLFVNIEGMTPGDFKAGGDSLLIKYCFSATPFGEVIVASTAKGVCFMAFVEERNLAVAELQIQFPHARFIQAADSAQLSALSIFTGDWNEPDQVKLHLKGTAFQIKVWEALLKIPEGRLSSYGDVAKQINQPRASRAVGSAIGSNPIAFLIPCHRVIQSGGTVGNYRWGTSRKLAMVGWEAAKNKH